MYYKIKGIILNSEIKTVESKKGDSFEKLYVTIEEKETGNDDERSDGQTNGRMNE